jgi:hypothetical protein
VQDANDWLPGPAFGPAPAVQRSPPSQALHKQEKRVYLAGQAHASAANARPCVKTSSSWHKKATNHCFLLSKLKRPSQPIMLLLHAADLAKRGLAPSCKPDSLEKPTNQTLDHRSVPNSWIAQSGLPAYLLSNYIRWATKDRPTASLSWFESNVSSRRSPSHTQYPLHNFVCPLTPLPRETFRCQNLLQEGLVDLVFSHFLLSRLCFFQQSALVKLYPF